MYLGSIIPMITYSTIYLAIEEWEGMDGGGVHWMMHSINRTLIHLSAFRGGKISLGSTQLITHVLKYNKYIFPRKD